MKFSTTTALAILASSVAVQAAPIDAAQAAHAQFASSTDLTFVKKSDAAQIKSLIAEISHINKKREFTDDPVELAELQRRADSAIGNLLSAFLNSGIISDIFNTLTTDSGIRSSLGSILSTVGSAIVQNAKPLLSAIWNSGILGKVFNDVINDKDLINAFLAAIPDVLLAVTSLLGYFTGGSSSSSTASSSGASKREILDMSNLSEDEYLSKRDLSSIIAWVVQEIKDSGIIQNLVNNFLQDPSKYLTIIGNVLLSALNIGEEIFNWAKSSGLLESGLNWLENNGGSFLGSLAKIISSLLGSSSSSSSSTPSTASAAAAAAPSPAAQGYANTVTTHTTTTAAVTAGAGPTTTAASGSNSGGVNAVFQAAQAAGKARRNY